MMKHRALWKISILNSVLRSSARKVEPKSYDDDDDNDADNYAGNDADAGDECTVFFYCLQMLVKQLWSRACVGNCTAGILFLFLFRWRLLH